MVLSKSLQTIKSGNIRPVYMLYGIEQYFIQLIKDTITQTLKKEVNEDIYTFDLLETPIQEIITNLETVPFFNERKLIFAYHPTFLTTKREKLPFTHDLARLEHYVKHPAPFSTFVLIAPYEKLDRRKNVTKTIEKHTDVINCAPVHEREMAKWIDHLAKNLQITIEKNAVALLENEFETNIQLLEREIEKLALYVGENGVVTKEITEQLMASSLTHDALQLVDAVLHKDLHRAITIYKSLEIMREDPIGLIALLAYQFRIILQVKLLRQKRMSQYAIQQKVKVHPYVIKLASERANRFKKNQLTQIIETLMETDKQIKQGKMDKAIGFELLLYRLIKT